MAQSANNAGPIVRAKAEAIGAAQKMARVALIGRFEPEQLVFTIPPSRSHILWLTGHIATAADGLAALITGSARVLPESYGSLFGRGSQPVADPAAYPPLEELLKALDQVFESAVNRALTLADDEMDRRLPEDAPVARIFPTVGDALTGIVLHTCYHSGQIAILRRAQGMPSGIGR